MNEDSTVVLPHSVLEALIEGRRGRGSAPGLLLLLLAGPLIASGFAGGFDLEQRLWRDTVLAPVMIGYMLLVVPVFRRYRIKAVVALRRLTALERPVFDQQVRTGMPRASREWLAFALGASLCLGLLQPWTGAGNAVWLMAYRSLATALMGAMAGGVIYVAVSGTWLLTRLHAQPLRLNVFDPVPLEPIARRSLMLSLIFLGGASLGLLLAPDQGMLPMLITGSIITLAVLMFFFGMHNTHRAMVRTKKRELATVRLQLAAAYAQIEAGGNTLPADEIARLSTLTSLLLDLEKRITEAPEWPFNKGMLRQLLLSLLVPLLIVIAQSVAVETILRSLGSK